MLLGRESLNEACSSISENHDQTGSFLGRVYALGLLKPSSKHFDETCAVRRSNFHWLCALFDTCVCGGGVTCTGAPGPKDTCDVKEGK